ncbi:MAG: acylphosphatase [Euryarchaeota archaeon]|nr:acylphosphatase [Euryarchaeota archaeon]
MPKLKVTITGRKVHDVAYRPFLLSIAEGFGIDRFFARNLTKEGQETVEALVEGDADKIDRFKEYVKENFPDNAGVADVSFSEHVGPVMAVESFYRFLTASQLSKIATYGGQMLGKQDQALGKMDQMLDKQDDLKSTVNEGFSDLKTTVNEGFSDLKTTVNKGFSDLKSTVNEGFSNLETTTKHGFSDLKEEHIKTREMSLEIFHSEV